MFSSLSFDGITINLISQTDNRIHLGLGYPSELNFSRKDLRSDPRIFKALKRKCKLKLYYLIKSILLVF